MKQATVPAVLVGVHLLCCSGAPGAEREGVPTWEEFKAESARIVDGQEFYVVESDIAVNSEEELQRYYIASFETSPATKAHQGKRTTSNPPIVEAWSLSAALDLTYCVSNNFGGYHQRAVTEMKAAALAWESVTNVRFRYLSGQNGSCTPGTGAVVISVRPWEHGGATSFYPTEAPGSIFVNYDDFEFNPFWEMNAPDVTTTGFLTHELGHILGLVHEAAFSDYQGCAESGEANYLTEYDPSSVMHYTWCYDPEGEYADLKYRDLLISNLDGIGIRAVYGMPAAWYVTTVL